MHQLLDIMLRSFQAYGNHAWALSKNVFIVSIPAMAISLLGFACIPSPELWVEQSLSVGIFGSIWWIALSSSSWMLAFPMTCKLALDACGEKKPSLEGWPPPQLGRLARGGLLLMGMYLLFIVAVSMIAALLMVLVGGVFPFLPIVFSLLIALAGAVWLCKFCLFPFYILDQDLGAIDALKKCAELNLDDTLKIFVMAFVACIVSSIGFQLFFIGVFIAAPVSAILLAFAYLELAKKEKSETIAVSLVE